MKLFAKVLCLVLLLPAGLAVPSQAPIQDEGRRFQEIQSKRNRGERLTPEELEFAQRMMAKRREQYAQEHPPRDSTGLIPLTDMGQETYQGEGGGLYSGGSNSPPSVHLNTGLEVARGIVPLDQNRRPSRDGKIVLLSVGMSNTTMEFQAFQKLAAAESDLNRTSFLWTVRRAASPLKSPPTRRLDIEKLSRTGSTARGSPRGKSRPPGSSRRPRSLPTASRVRPKTSKLTWWTLCTTFTADTPI